MGAKLIFQDYFSDSGLFFFFFLPKQKQSGKRFVEHKRFSPKSFRLFARDVSPCICCLIRSDKISISLSVLFSALWT